jgi:hypothetical protein
MIMASFNENITVSAEVNPPGGTHESGHGSP